MLLRPGGTVFGSLIEKAKNIRLKFLIPLDVTHCIRV